MSWRAPQPDGVDLDVIRLEGDGLAVAGDGVRLDGGQGAPEPEQALLQAVARLPLAMVAPEQRRQLVAAVGHAGRQGKIGEQGAIFWPTISRSSPRGPCAEKPPSSLSRKAGRVLASGNMSMGISKISSVICRSFFAKGQEDVTDGR